MKPLDFISVSELSKLIKNKEVSPTELLDITLKKIEKLDPILNNKISYIENKIMEIDNSFTF